jgi:hypothetical protein
MTSANQDANLQGCCLSCIECYFIASELNAHGLPGGSRSLE